METKDHKPHEGHRQRIKKRYMEKGVEALDDKDILELLLTYSIPRKDVYNISRELVHRFGSLGNVLSADPALLRDTGLISEHTIVLLKLVNDFHTKPLNFIEYRREQLVSVKDACEYCCRVLGGASEEAVIVLFIDRDGFVTELTKVSYGSADTAVLPIDVITESASAQNASRVLIAHNHPSSSEKPSSADVFATAQLRRALSDRGIELAEHIIVTESCCTALLHHQTVKVDCGAASTPWKNP